MIDDGDDFWERSQPVPVGKRRYIVLERRKGSDGPPICAACGALYQHGGGDFTWLAFVDESAKERVTLAMTLCAGCVITVSDMLAAGELRALEVKP
jgi:hypothetical protein